MNNFMPLKFEAQANYNKLALIKNPELKKKYEFLVELTKVCETEKIHWALSCSALLFFKGIWGEFHDFDVIVAPDDCDRFAAVLMNELEFHEEPIYSDQSIYSSLSFRRFAKEKIEVEVICEWGIIGGGNAEYKYHFDNKQIDIVKVSDDLFVPLMPLEALFALYRMLSWYQPERTMKSHFVHLYLEENVEHYDVIYDALSQNLPNTIRAEIEDLIS